MSGVLSLRLIIIFPAPTLAVSRNFPPNPEPSSSPLGNYWDKSFKLNRRLCPSAAAGPHVSSQLAVGPGGAQSRWIKPVWFYISLEIRVAGSVMLSPQPRPRVNVRATGSDLALPLPLPLVTVNTRDKSTSHARNSHTEESKERKTDVKMAMNSWKYFLSSMYIK